MFRFFLIFFLFFSPVTLFAEDSFLTLKQQLDRLQREVSDLSKSVYSSYRDTESIQNESNIETIENETDGSRFTAFDLRIYDLEKDIKKLNENFEELSFKIDDISKLYEELNLNIQTLLLQNQNNTEKEKNLENDSISYQNIDNEESITEKENENSLGNLVISSEDLSDVDENNNLSLEKPEKISSNINPEDQFQLAFDLLRNQKFILAKEALLEFIDNNKENVLSGSAHYWLGEIYILKKEYKDAALILAEGYQNYPNSIKAPDILYKLSDSLVNIDKKEESCNILKKLSDDYPENKLSEKANEKMIELKCT